LRADNDAVLLATGRWVGRSVGPTNPQIEPAIKFLWDVKHGERTSVPDKVVVIGGGAVAFDVAMSAPRLGAETTLVALEQRDQMLAPPEEIEEAVEDGVKLLNGWATKEFVMEDGKLQKLVLQRCLRVFDDDYNPALEFDSDDLMEIEADLVISAIGQETDLSFLDGDIDLDERRNIMLDTAFQTSAEGVFAAGDIKAPGLVISAVAEGKRAAMSIDIFLGGSGIHFGRAIDIPEPPLNPRIWDIPRAEAAKLEPVVRLKDFTEVESVFNREQALAEADRCMRCDRNSKQQLHLRTFPEVEAQFVEVQ
jgi:NADH-quinone oxidoreductase subunit F